MNSTWFRVISVVVIILNALVYAMPYNLQPGDRSKTLDNYNIFTMILFIIEVVLRLVIALIGYFSYVIMLEFTYL